MADGKISQTVSEYCTVNCRIDERCMYGKFNIAKLNPKDDILLGYPWLIAMNPTFDWRKSTVALNHNETSQRREHDCNEARRKKGLTPLPWTLKKTSAPAQVKKMVPASAQTKKKTCASVQVKTKKVAPTKPPGAVKPVEVSLKKSKNPVMPKVAPLTKKNPKVSPPKTLVKELRRTPSKPVERTVVAPLTLPGIHPIVKIPKE